ncbi:hypothetical protein GGH92_010920, partial [Coemansia sp. RSA 2673]
NNEDYPFDEDQVLLQSNAATLKLLKLTLTCEQAAALLQHKVPKPTSHPKLQGVMLETLQRFKLSINTDLIRLTLNIAPGAAIKIIFSGYFYRLHLLTLSLLRKHTRLQDLSSNKVAHKR